MNIKNQYLTIEQVSETLNLGTRAVMNMVRRGELPAIRRIGGTHSAGSF
jgi:excisionase family DNA binding protein